MPVALHFGTKTFEIGTASLLSAFFSTVCVRLEGDRWGDRFPVIMKELFMGRLEVRSIAAALSELHTIRTELESFQPNDVVWNRDDRSKRPPWGDKIAPSIKTLASYFVTSDGKDLFSVMTAALFEASLTAVTIE